MDVHRGKGKARNATYRGDIEGLRALAALLVAIFHIWMNKVSGGVDVFFVVSGYLITLSLLRQCEQQGRVRPLLFWTGLAKRLLPAALLVIAAVLIGTWLFLPRSMWMSSMKESLAAIFYMENWLLALNSVDYLARDQLPSPVQHYWALSAQGQFYFLWPFIILLALQLSHQLAVARQRALLLTFGAVFALSLGFSVLHTASNQTFAYFNTFARVWQFALGALVAVISWSRLPAVLLRTMGWLGLTAVVSCGFVLDVSLSFPGYIALWPSLGAALILAAGAAPLGRSAAQLLSSRPLTWLGSISYAFYLWHWPVMIFFRATFHDVGVTWYGGLVIILLSGVLAYFTTRLIENPVRLVLGKKSDAHTAAVALVAVFPLVVAIFLWRGEVRELAEAYRVPELVDAAIYPGAHALATGSPVISHPEVPIIPEPFMAGLDVPTPYKEGCHQSVHGTDAKACRYGDPQAKLTIAVAGSSHATHWVPALKIVAKERGWNIVSYTKSGCRFTADARQSPDNQENSCALWNENVLKAIGQLQPDYVFTTATVAATAKRPEHVPDGYAAQWEKVRHMGIGILAVRDTPFMGFHVPTCVDMNGPHSIRCARPRSAALAAALDITETPLGAPGSLVHFIDMSNYFCTAESCPAVAGNILIYKDRSHISTLYMKSLSRFLAEAIDRSLTLSTARETGHFKQAESLVLGR